MWNRIRYTAWAPGYDALAGAVGFTEARRRSIGRLNLGPGDRVLLVGAGTGLDLEYLPAGVAITAVDVTPAMLKRLQARAARSGREVSAHVMDARKLQFADESFDAVVMHLIVAVMPDPDGVSKRPNVCSGQVGALRCSTSFFARANVLL